MESSPGAGALTSNDLIGEGEIRRIHDDEPQNFFLLIFLMPALYIVAHDV